MPKFVVTRLVDSFIEYTTEIVAKDKEQALAVASRSDFGGKWKRVGEREYDYCEFPDDEVEEVRDD